MIEFITESVLPVALFAMMLGLGTSVSIKDLRSVFIEPRSLVIGIVILAVLSPSAGFVIAWALNLSPDLAVGLILLASCPGGLFSNYMSSVGKGNVALSISLTASVSLIYIFTSGFWAHLSTSAFSGSTVTVAIPYSRVLIPLLAFLLVPVVIGVLLRAHASEIFLKVGHVARDVGGITAICCYLIIVYAQRDTLFVNAVQSLSSVLVLDLVVLVAAFTLCRLGALPIGQRIPILLESTIRQEATGVYIATAILGSLTVALPLLINAVVGFILSVIVVSFYHRLLKHQRAEDACIT